MSAAWSASHRYGVAPAPSGLGLVQDFLNTKGVEGYAPDLLADTGLAEAWAADAVAAWSQSRGVEASPPALDDADLVRLRSLRTAIGALIDGQPPSDAETGGVAATFVLSGFEVRLQPSGSGWRWLASALWGEILLSQQAGTWRRVKQCRNHQCGTTFYDRSKNNSGVWHDVKTCGNVANLRASRARRRERDAESGGAE
ncbi:CGNR zinc finger domain-containing protein [Mycobacterium sp. 050134]|uniref:CGNR zinc finger domain-containing protein n=1 Tax=Mycobacterium sp. 050134 TaxID=3096111 RepID=UPI002EDA0F25